MGSSSYLDASIPEGKDNSPGVNCGVCLRKCPVNELSQQRAVGYHIDLLSRSDSKDFS